MASDKELFTDRRWHDDPFGDNKAIAHEKVSPEERKASKKRFEEILKHYHVIRDDESLSD